MEIESVPDDTDVLQSDLFRLTEWCKPDSSGSFTPINVKQDTSKESYTLDRNG